MNIERLGNYRVIRLIGKGGMSEVYEVENERLGSRHALKLFSSEVRDDDVRARFETEGRLLARLNHPGIVRVTDIGTEAESGRPYFVMDLVTDAEGRVRSLAEADAMSLDEETIGAWYDDLREALRYIHSMGVVHRDLKLQNVLIGPDGRAVLADFGISRIFDPEGGDNTVVDVVNTLVRIRDGRNLVMGSVGYMAPELEMGVQATPQSDWFALGIIVFKLLTGTWCDSRTDLVATLETYDPVWRRILPKLLHANPQGRACLSYRDEKRVDREKAEFENEERWLKAKDRGHSARHVARYLAAGLVAAGFTAGLIVLHFTRQVSSDAARIAELEAKVAMPDFASACTLPERQSVTLGDDITIDTDMSQLSLIDAWVLVHDVFDDLKAEKITPEKARDELKIRLRKVNNEMVFLYDGIEGYSECGDRKQVAAILENAIKVLTEYAEGDDRR